MQRDMPFIATALRAGAPSETLRAALLAHDKLLARVARRRQVRDQLEQDLRHAVTQVATRMAALIEETRSLDEQIHALFDAFVADRSRPRAEREKIRRLHRELEGRVLSRRGFWEDYTGPGTASAREGDDADDVHPAAPSATRPAERGALRGLFRRLAEVLHPDKVQDAADKAARTEAMKQVNVAYQEGDLARLIQIERTWSTTAAPHDGNLEPEDDVDRRLAALERIDEELRVQLRQIERQIRVLRASPDGELAKEVRRHGSVDGVTQPAEDELRSLRAVRDFVCAFRDGRISLEVFLDGPNPAGEENDDEVIGELDEALAALAMLLHDEITQTEDRAGAGAQRRARRQRNGTKRARR